MNKGMRKNGPNDHNWSVQDPAHPARQPGGALAGWDIPDRPHPLLQPSQFESSYASNGMGPVEGIPGMGNPREKDTLYHGTNAELKVGDTINGRGRDSNYAPGKSLDTTDPARRHTYGTYSTSDAYYHAAAAVQHHVDTYGSEAEPIGNGDRGNDDVVWPGLNGPPAGERRHVYVVKPMGRLTRDPEIEPEERFPETPSVRSRQPMRVVGKADVLARQEYNFSYGEDIPHPNHESLF